MALNEAGRAAARCWRDIPIHFPHAALDEWVVMPDPVHGVIVIRRDGRASGGGGTGSRGETSFAPTPDTPNPPVSHTMPIAPSVASSGAPPRGPSRTIGSIVRGFKIGVTKSLRGESPWQRGYYDIIVRDARALASIRAYIRNNPTHWDGHRYGAPRFFVGNRALLDLRARNAVSDSIDSGGSA